jgi:hypothetical protein
MNNLVSPFFFIFVKKEDDYMASQRIEGLLNQIHNEGLNTIPFLNAEK